MVKRILISFIYVAFFNVPINAQDFHLSLGYQSLRPFVRFQLDFGKQMSRNAYRTAYLKGYMDGVNSNYYYNHRFEEMVENIQIYKAGYRDGMRDRSLLIRLRGRRWLRRHCFTYRDYYSPYAAVRIWLEGITLAFIKAPARRLPPGWRHKIHPRARKYRKWMRKRHRRNRRWRRHGDFDDYEDYYEEYYEEYEEEYEDDD